MRLAVEHGHKNFAGHIYCQQVVRDKFYGGWWSDMGFMIRDGKNRRSLCWVTPRPSFFWPWGQDHTVLPDGKI